MTCLERKRLFERWCDASKRYQDAVFSATGRTGAEFDSAQRHVVEEKASCDRAEAALNEHENNHGCAGQSKFRDSA